MNPNNWSLEKPVFVWVYAVILLSDLLVSLAASPAIRIFTKPLLMLWLIYMASDGHLHQSSLRRWIFPALLFSLAGDVFLIFSHANWTFLAGLCSFLLAHLIYSWIFLQEIRIDRLRKCSIRVILTVITPGIAFLSLTWSGLERMKIPVLIYALVISIMVVLAIHRDKAQANNWLKGISAGALLFMLSDLVLACNLFYRPIPLASIWIMTTYAIGQYLIVRGQIYRHLGAGSEK